MQPRPRLFPLCEGAVGAGHVPPLGGKLQLILGRGGRGVRVSCLKMLGLKLMNLCISALFLRHKYIEEIV